MPVEWRDYEFSSEGRLGEFKLYADFDEDNKQWFAISVVGAIAHFPTREAAKSAAEAEARRVLWAGLKALGAPDIKRAITAWFSPVRQQDTEGLFDLADYEADMRRAFDAGMEPDNGQ